MKWQGSQGSKTHPNPHPRRPVCALCICRIATGKEDWQIAFSQIQDIAFAGIICFLGDSLHHEECT